MTRTIGEGKKVVEAVNAHGRMFRLNTWFRFKDTFYGLGTDVKPLKKIIDSGILGWPLKVTVSGITGYDWKFYWSGEHNLKPMPVPDGFDYPTWLGPAPDAPYHADRCLYRFRFNLDYSGGQVTNTGAHSNDIVQWALGTDDTAPVEFEDTGSVWPPEGHLYNTAVTTSFRARYASGVELICQTQKPGFGVRFEGTEGWVQYAEGKVTTHPVSLADSQIGSDELHLPISTNHYRNFLDCVKSREEPIEPVEVGHRTASICHAGNIAMQLKRKVRWDPQRECFIDDDEANRMLRRPYREPWHL